MAFIRVYIHRYIGCSAALLIIGAAPSLPAALAWAALLALLFTAVKPLYSLLVLPLDMLLYGLGTLCLDALMIIIVLPYDMPYWHALAAAAIVRLCFVPYERARGVRA
jgi:uncharacterized membrane protein YvlD (DUF360 family)